MEVSEFKVPNGWKLAPEEPTREMFVAANKADDKAYAGGCHHGADNEDIWHAMLAAAPAAPTADGTSSDKYRAELYDEVWQRARDMGYGNATDALVELERLKAAAPAVQAEQQPVAWALVDSRGHTRLLHITEGASREAEARWSEAYEGCSHVPLYAAPIAQDAQSQPEQSGLRKDAERYRFIADNACDVIMSASMTDYGDGDTTSGPRVEVAPDQYPTGIFGTAKTKLDAAIDAALAAKEVNP